MWTAKITIYCQLFNIGILQQMFKMSAVCTARNTSTETLTPLLDIVVNDTLVHALLLLSDALPQSIRFNPLID